MNRAERRRMQRANRSHGRGWTKPARPTSAKRMEAVAEGTAVLSRMMGHVVPADRPRLLPLPAPSDRPASEQQRSWWRNIFRRAA